ncbi:hypothetical protein BDP55DRAFT_638691 [Colletotrichum godetiae]|uniref:Uncharacterized protein n=1 Tax=Colletotrichum godetiae TaxID=1209918 RepID=A0AAJ0AAK2_9PEZI|nr:uncharacterized protein BDP55DRAFT_638691 [Colletotrichum godetiae]KAK1657520.1 hypothetical protein BDP55DRAFT_638691 [Colletotrichum godetiae]
MSNNINQCTCSATFSTNEALSNHVAEYRFQESYMSTQLEKCRAHAIATSDNGNEDDHREQGSCVDKCDKPSPMAKICPHEDCERTKPFTTGQRLRRHFQQRDFVHPFIIKLLANVKVQMSLAKKLASEFMRHVEVNHKQENGRKANYMQMTYQELASHVANELDTANKTASLRSAGKKRSWDVADMDAAPSKARRTKLNTMSVRGMDHTQHATGVSTFFSSMPLATTFNPIQDATGGTLLSSLEDISTQGFHPDLVGQEGQLSGDTYDAPLLQMISSIPCTGDMGWVEEMIGQKI